MQKKSFLAILQFLDLTGKIAKFRKIRIFECNSTPNYSEIGKFLTSRQDLNIQTLFSAILEFSI